MVLDAFRHLRDHAGILRHQIIAAHARHAREAGGDDHHIGTGNGGIIARADHVRIKPIHRAGLHEVQRLARGNAGEDIEHHDVAKFLETNEVSQSAADITGADQSNFLAGHVASLNLAWKTPDS